jgi:hypothetical protein
MIKRSVNLVVGFFLVICGIIITPLPIPVGLILIVLGLSLLVPALPVLRRWLTLARSRFPKLSNKLQSIRHRLPKFARNLIDHTEPQTESALNQIKPYQHKSKQHKPKGK